MSRARCDICDGVGGWSIDTGGFGPDGEPVEDWERCSQCGGVGFVDRQSQRDRFEEALLDNPYDEAVHRVFSDWLEEQGLDHEAEFHRLWTPAWQRAFEWISNFAGRIGRSYDQVLFMARRRVETGELTEAPFDVVNGPDYDSSQEFWANYEILTRAMLPTTFDRMDGLTTCSETCNMSDSWDDALDDE